MIDTLISSKTRIKLLLKFFLNSQTKAYLRSLEEEFGDSTNAIRVELNRFEEAGMLKSELDGNKKFYTANTSHPLFKDVHNIIMKYVGLDSIVEHIVKQLGDIEKIYLTGSFARGIDNGIIDLVFIGNVNKLFLVELIEKAERLVGKKIRYITFAPGEMEESETLLNTKYLLLWSK
jgi:predicted nucleotidyltransferase